MNTLTEAPVSAAAISEALHWRYATKKFDPTKKLSDEQWDVLQRALHLAASSFGLQPWKFVVVSDDAKKAALRADAWDQQQVEACSHLVVICAKKHMTEADVDRLMQATAQARGAQASSLDGYKGMIVGSLSARTPEWIAAWNARQCYIALGFLLEAAALLRVDACPMEGFVPEKFDEQLGLSDSDYTATAICALGFRAAADKYGDLAKVRYPESEVFEFVG